MTVSELREALDGVNDDVVVLLRIANDRLNTPACSPNNASFDVLEDGTEVFVVSGTDGDFKNTGLRWS